MATPYIYTVTIESVSDRPLAALLAELLIEMLETDPPHLCVDRVTPL